MKELVAEEEVVEEEEDDEEGRRNQKAYSTRSWSPLVDRKRTR